MIDGEIVEMKTPEECILSIIFIHSNCLQLSICFILKAYQSLYLLVTSK